VAAVRRRYLVIGAAVVAAVGLGVGLWLGLAGGGEAEPTAKAYTAEVSTACRSYARRLQRVPAPGDPAAYGDVIASLERVLPLLRGQEAAMRAVRAPAALEARLERLFELDGRSIAELEGALAAARQRRAGGVATGLVRFVRLRDRVHSAAVALGIDCTVN
jgi:hypothetical protein